MTIHSEAFSQGKLFAAPEANEDALLIAPGAGYAVIDGVSDRTGARIEGVLSGRFVAQAARRGLMRLLAEPPEAWFGGAEDLVRRLGAQIEQAYAAAGVDLAAHPRMRGGCAFAAVIHVGERLEFVALGDCGARVVGARGVETLTFPKPLDEITATLRREAWRWFAARGATAEACDSLARAAVMEGLARQNPGAPTADPALLAHLRARLMAERAALWPQIPEQELTMLIEGGIAHGQEQFMNQQALALGYGALNGTPVPPRFLEARSWPLAEVESLELFTDGYFALGAGFGVAAWETAFRQVEAEDPHKLGPWLSTKGSSARGLADDRTYLGLRLR